MFEFRERLDLEHLKPLLKRVPWKDFPDALICADEATATRHVRYAAAKAGDPKAAEALIDDLIGEIDEFPSLTRDAEKPTHLLAVHAVEAAGMNAIPRAFARSIAERYALPIASGVIQVNRVIHTRADGYHRLAFPPVFEGKVEAADYILVDDFIGQGGTLANLRGHVESNGGTVLGAVVLAGKRYSAKLALDPETLETLRSKHGRGFEEWWIATFGFGFTALTESEARYLIRSDNAERIAARLIAARRAGDRPSTGGEW